MTQTKQKTNKTHVHWYQDRSNFTGAHLRLWFIKWRLHWSTIMH